ncbi:MAG: ABC transporter ATP-binding protein [Planctomycetes bacterium]|nr:ABC transporter ATP-binding protein [Planctomycetota bacterium]
MNKVVEARGLRLEYGAEPALRGVDFEVERGELVVLLGPSGCGKTSLLRVLAGLERPAAGRIEIAGRCVQDDGLSVEPAARGVGFVFQDLGLWPTLTVLEHLLFVLGPGRRDRKEVARRRLDDLHIGHLAGKKPAQLSGGEAQRLALARALVAEPELIFLDEPLSSLDPLVAGEIRRLLARIHREEGRSMVYVTHDRHEAFELADRIVLMRGGEVEQIGRAPDLVGRPRTAFVARFLGLGGLLEARAVAADQIETALGRHRLIEGSPAAAGLALIGRRDLRPAAAGVSARVVGARYRGADWSIELDLAGAPLEFDHDRELEIGAQITVAGPESVWCIPGEGGRE